MIRIGISGWRYPPWRGVFYPEGLPQKDELEYASHHLTSIEINGSFYSLQQPHSYQSWHDVTPADFVFSVKGPRYVTHIRRLKNVEAPVANFFASGVLRLRKKLGPILWQLPPSFVCNLDRLDEFFKILPHTKDDVKKLVKKADRVSPDKIPDFSRPLRHALEVRHYSFENPEFISLLSEHNVALVFADTAGKWPYFEDITSDFVYIRLHGEKKLYASGYGDKSLHFWQKRIQAWHHGKQPKEALTLLENSPASAKSRDVFIYFDNDVKVRAPFDAMKLMKFLKPNRNLSY